MRVKGQEGRRFKRSCLLGERWSGGERKGEVRWKSRGDACDAGEYVGLLRSTEPQRDIGRVERKHKGICLT